MNFPHYFFRFAALAVLLGSPFAQAQDFYQQGDSMSQRVSNTLRNIFNPGGPPQRRFPDPPPRPQVQPQQRIQQAPPQAAPQQPRGYAQPQQPMYRQAPPTSAPVSKPKPKTTSAKKSKPTSTKPRSSTTSSSKRYSPPVVDDEDMTEAPIEKPQAETTLRAPQSKPVVKEDPEPAAETSRFTSTTPVKSQTSQTATTKVQDAPPSAQDTGGLSPFMDGFSDVGAAAAKSAATTTSEAPEVKPTSPTTPSAPPAPAPTPPPPVQMNVNPSEIVKVLPGDQPGFIKFPYPPYKVVDVRGLKSGSVAMDPDTKQIFMVP
jgi:hypothetical protein